MAAVLGHELVGPEIEHRPGVGAAIDIGVIAAVDIDPNPLTSIFLPIFPPFFPTLPPFFSALLHPLPLISYPTSPTLYPP
jgi:hypothetical protein